MADSRSAAEQWAVEEREQQQLAQFLDHAACTPELWSRLNGVDPDEVVDIAAADGYQFGAFNPQRAMGTGCARPKVRE